MSNQVITAVDPCPIQPEHIDATAHLFGAFDDDIATETAAGWIVRFMQEQGKGWKPFSFEEISEFYRQHVGTPPSDQFSFQNLLRADLEEILVNAEEVFDGKYDPTLAAGTGWILKGDDDKYYVTEKFLTHCYNARPAHPIMV